MIQKISIVVLPLFMSAASAYAIAPVQTHHVPPIKRHHMTHGGMMIPNMCRGPANQGQMRVRFQDRSPWGTSL
jgi:hypothetical protein